MAKKTPPKKGGKAPPFTKKGGPPDKGAKGKGDDNLPPWLKKGRKD